MNKSLGAIILMGISLSLLQMPAMALTSYRNTFTTRYPNSTLDTTQNCAICHLNGDTGSGQFTDFGTDFLNATGTTTQRYDAVDPMDSDGDGFTNLQELTANTDPSNVNSVPASTPTPTRTPTQVLPTATPTRTPTISPTPIQNSADNWSLYR